MVVVGNEILPKFSLNSKFLNGYDQNCLNFDGNAFHMKQAGAELCQAQAQLGYHTETTTKKELLLKSWKLFELYETVTKQV